MKRVTLFSGVKPNAQGKFCRELGAMAFILLFTSILAAPAKAQSPSAYAGKYSGEWVAQLPLEEDHTGTWVISIDADGELTGTEHDHTTGGKAQLSGFIDEDGYVNLFCKYPSATTSIKGTLTKKGIRLTGKLKQYSGNRVLSTFDIILKRTDR